MFFYFDLHKLLSFEKIDDLKVFFQKQLKLNPQKFMLSFFLGYFFVAALSLPGAAILTLLAGALFGFSKALLIVSFASSLGATACFLIARFLLKETLQEKFGDRFKSIQEGFERDGTLYLLSLRLIPAVPFFLVNLLMALTRIKTLKFYIVSQLGMLIGTAIFVNAGTQLAGIKNPKDILNPALVFSLILLAVAPFLIKKIFKTLRGQYEKI